MPRIRSWRSPMVSKVGVTSTSCSGVGGARDGFTKVRLRRRRDGVGSRRPGGRHGVNFDGRGASMSSSRAGVYTTGPVASGGVAGPRQPVAVVGSKRRGATVAVEPQTRCALLDETLRPCRRPLARCPPRHATSNLRGGGADLTGGGMPAPAARLRLANSRVERWRETAVVLEEKARRG